MIEPEVNNENTDKELSSEEKGFRRFFSIKKLLLALLGIILLALAGFLWRLQHAPLGFSSVSHSIVGKLYLHPRGNISPFKGGAIGEATWKHMSVQWVFPRNRRAFFKSMGGSIEVRVDGVELSTIMGTSVHHLGKAALKLHVLPLFVGKLSAEEIYVDDLDVALFKSPQGKIKLWFPGLVLHKRDKIDDDSAPEVDALQSVVASKIVIRFMSSNDPGAREQARFYLSGLSIANIKDGAYLKDWQGTAEASLSFPGYPKAAVLTAESHVSPQGVEGWTANFKMDRPDLLEVIVPQLKAVKLPIELHAETISPTCNPFGGCQLAVKGHLGAGEFVQPPVPSLRLDSVNADAIVGWQGFFKDLTVRVSDIEVHGRDRRNAPVFVKAKGGTTIDNPAHIKVMDIDVDGFTPHVDFSTIGSVWPYHALKNVRGWIDENMTHGLVDNVHIVTHLHSEDGPDALVASKLEGDIEGRDITVHWLRPMPPFEHANAHAHFISPESIKIDVSNGHMRTAPGHNVLVKSGSVLINGLMQHEQWGDIHLDIKGDLAAGLDILESPRLAFLSRLKPLPYKNSSGHVDGNLYISLPFADWITMDQIWIDAHAKISNASMDWDVIGPLRKMNGNLHVTTHKLESEGRGLVRGLPFAITLEDNSNLTADEQLMRHLSLSTTLTHDDFKKLGVKVDPIEKGRAKISIDWLQFWHPDDPITAKINLAADLTKAAISIPVWHKEAGVQASLGGELHVTGDSITALENVFAHGPDLQISGHGILEKDEIRGFDATEVRIGKNEGKVSMHWPGVKMGLGLPGLKHGKKDHTQKKIEKDHGRNWSLDVNAVRIDLSPFYQKWMLKKPKDKKGKEDKHKKLVSKEINTTSSLKGLSWLEGKNWRADIKAQDVSFSDLRIMKNLDIHTSGKDLDIHDSHITIDKPYPVEASLTGLPKLGSKKLHIRIDQLGSWLKWLEDDLSLEGGDFLLDGTFSSVPYLERNKRDALFLTRLGLSDFAGNANIKKLSWLETPTLLNAFLALDPVRWGHKLDRIIDLKAKTQVKLTGDHLRLIEGQGGNDLIGISFAGDIKKLETQPYINITGGFSPFFYINGFLGRIGSVFSSHKGDGILAATYHIKGDLSDPHVSVNPMTMFLPGAMRRLVQN